MKKLLAMMICSALVCAFLGSASAAWSSDLTSTLGDFSQYGDGNLEKYDPPIDVSIGININQSLKFFEGDSYDNNVWSRAYRDELGINLSLAYTTPDSGEKVNALIAAGDIPDIMVVNAAQLAILADSGLINDNIYPVYQDNAGEQLRMIVEGVGGKAAFAKTDHNGKMIAFPQIKTEFSPTIVWLRTDWMEKLGLSDPQSYADLRAIMKAFSEKDPDGNGQDDTYGIAFTKNPADGTYMMNGFFDIFGSHPLPGFWVEDPQDPSKVVYGAFQPETKAALTELHSLYAEGILDQEFAVKNASAVTELVASGKVGLVIGAVWITNGVLNASVDNDPGADWHAVMLPGLSSPTALNAQEYPVLFYYVFRKDFEHPEALIKMINLHYAKCFSEDSTIETYQTYIENASGISPFQIYPWGSFMPPLKNAIAADLIKQGVATSELPPFAKAFGTFVEAYKAGDTSMWRWYRFFGPDGGHLVAGRYIREGLHYFNRFYGPYTETMNENLALVTQLVDEMIVKITMGVEPVDSFEKYRQQAEALGLPQMIEEANAWLAQHKD